jgi:O-antigen ligase
MTAMHSLSAPLRQQALVSREPRWCLASCAAIALPILVAPRLPPAVTFPNQALALFAWGIMLAMLAGVLPARPAAWTKELRAFAVALALILAAALASPWWTSLPHSMALPAAGMLTAAALTTIVGAALQQAGFGAQAFRALCIAILIAAVLNACIAVVQIYAPSWVDGQWIAHKVAERAVGNLRQSNHLVTVLLWGVIAAVWLGETRALRRTVVAPLALLLMFGVVLSASRSGVVGVMLLALWGLLDRRLNGRARILLLLAPVAYGLLWAGTAAWAHQSHQVFVGEARLTSTNNLTSSRFGMWENTFELIRTHPWLGVGFGEFNFAWSMTEFPGRPTPFFDHTHNLPLQLGLPLAALVLALLGWAFWAAGRNCWRGAAPDAAASPVRPAFAMLCLVLLHSMLEYPLWYAYFLLPTAFIFGLCLGDSTRGNQASAQVAPTAGQSSALRPAALLLMLGAAFSVLDYFRVVPIFMPLNPHTPLDERIATGQGSVFFSHHADYGAATNSEAPGAALRPAQRAAHNLLDTRLMMAWANSLHATGDEDRARYVAQRLKEFRNPISEPYFAPCTDSNLSEDLRPFQCFAPQRKFTFEDFR